MARIENNNLSEENREILNILSEETILKIFNITKGRKISFRPLINYIKRNKIKQAIETTNKPFAIIANENNISRTSIYRILKYKTNEK